MSRTAILFCLVIGALVFVGCGVGGDRLGHAAESPEALATAVLTAIEHRDVEALRALALTEQEFREEVWPDLPAARPERNLPFSFVWGDLHQKSEGALGRTLQAHGGRRYLFESIEFLDGATQYKTYVVRRRSMLTVRTPDGQQERLALFGSVLVKNGRFKVFSYVVD